MSFSLFQPCSDLIHIHIYIYRIIYPHIDPCCSIQMWSTIRILLMFSANNCSPTSGTSLTSWWPFLVHLFHDRANVLVPRMSAGENGQTSYWTTKSCVKSERSVSNRINISVVNYLRLATSSKQLSLVPLITILAKSFRPSQDCDQVACVLFLSAFSMDKPAVPSPAMLLQGLSQDHCMIWGETWNWIKRRLNHYLYLLCLQHLEKGWLLLHYSITPLKTNMTTENNTMCNRRYIFIAWCFSIVIRSFSGISYLHQSLQHLDVRHGPRS